MILQLLKKIDACCFFSVSNVEIGAYYECFLDDTALRSVRGEVKEIAVGTSHIALLLKDGRLARLPFSVISDRYSFVNNHWWWALN